MHNIIYYILILKMKKKIVSIFRNMVFRISCYNNDGKYKWIQLYLLK